MIFEQKPFHPLIDPKTGQLYTHLEFPEWNPSITPIWKLIEYIKSIFVNVEKEIQVLHQMLESFCCDSKTGNDELNHVDVRHGDAGLPGCRENDSREIISGEDDDKPKSGAVIEAQNEGKQEVMVEQKRNKICSSQTNMTQVNMSRCMNINAVKMFREDKSCFQFKVAEVVVESRANIYEPSKDASDPNAIIFGPFEPDIHEDIRQNQLLSGRSTRVYDDSLPAILYIKGNEVTIN